MPQHSKADGHEGAGGNSGPHVCAIHHHSSATEGDEYPCYYNGSVHGLYSILSAIRTAPRDGCPCEIARDALRRTGTAAGTPDDRAAAF